MCGLKVACGQGRNDIWQKAVPARGRRQGRGERAGPATVPLGKMQESAIRRFECQVYVLEKAFGGSRRQNREGKPCGKARLPGRVRTKVRGRKVLWTKVCGRKVLRSGSLAGFGRLE